jgi:thiol-disulfide isomerase/thioredoxin/Tfp pilus assembly protein PilF
MIARPTAVRGFLTLAALVAAVHGAPASAEDRAAARSAFTEARKLFASDIAASVAGLRRAVELDPDYYEAHQYHVLYAGVAATRTGTEEEKKAAAEKARAELQAWYQGRTAAEPRRAAYRYGLGKLFMYSDPDRSRRLFEEAVALDPACGDGFDSLAIHAEIRGELEASRALFRRAVDADPASVTFWRHHVASQLGVGMDSAVAAGLEMARRFPDDAASIIGYLASRARTEDEAWRVHELLRERFRKASARSLTGLFAILQRRDPARALALAEEMRKDFPEVKEWVVLADYARAVSGLEPSIREGRGAEALAALEKISLPRYGADRRFLDLALARARSALGRGEEAYAGLLAAVATRPTDETRAALDEHGRLLGKTAAGVAAELSADRAGRSLPAEGFRLTNLATGRDVSLAEYRGRVVLVNFWYPLCGPCRGEFPFLQAVLEKYRSRGFEILAINGHAPEEHMVLPLLKGWSLGFLPLRGSEDVVKSYKVRGYPMNILVGPDGKSFYDPPPVSTLAAQRELELQIEALLPSGG